MTRILLYTTDPTSALGFASLFEGRSDLRLAGICGRAKDIPAKVEKEKPDILLLDLTPELTFQLLRDVKKSFWSCRVLIWANTISMEVVFQLMGLGVRGIVKKTLSTDDLLACLGKVAQGELWFEKSLTDHMLNARRVSLTRREGQLVTLLSHGLKNKTIAHLLSISENTVKVYLSRLFAKAGVKDRFELALHGFRNVAFGHDRLDDPVKGEDGPCRVLGLRTLIVETISSEGGVRNADLPVHSFDSLPSPDSPPDSMRPTGPGLP